MGGRREFRRRVTDSDASKQPTKFSQTKWVGVNRTKQLEVKTAFFPTRVIPSTLGLHLLGHRFGGHRCWGCHLLRQPEAPES